MADHKHDLQSECNGDGVLTCRVCGEHVDCPGCDYCVAEEDFDVDEVER